MKITSLVATNQRRHVLLFVNENQPTIQIRGNEQGVEIFFLVQDSPTKAAAVKTQTFSRSVETDTFVFF